MITNADVLVRLIRVAVTGVVAVVVHALLLLLLLMVLRVVMALVVVVVTDLGPKAGAILVATWVTIRRVCQCLLRLLLVVRLPLPQLVLRLWVRLECQQLLAAALWPFLGSFVTAAARGLGDPQRPWTWMILSTLLC